MIKFKGRSSIKQYMPKKPTNRGYKVWVRCDSITGYVYQFEIYTGKTDTGEVSTGLGGKLVMNLSQAVVGSGCHFTFDNFFTSYELMEKLYASNIFATGTVLTNGKDLPQVARRTTAMSKGESEWRTKNNTAYVCWRDTKDVHLLSTAFNPSTERSVQRTQKDRNAATVNCPETTIEYTKRMGGVDRLDERRGRYSVSRRSRRWWLRIFYLLVDCCVVDAHILDSSVHPDETITILEFRQQVFRGLVAGCRSR